MWGGGGVGEKIKICEGGPQNFPFLPPPQDLKWNSPNRISEALSHLHTVNTLLENNQKEPQIFHFD